MAKNMLIIFLALIFSFAALVSAQSPEASPAGAADEAAGTVSAESPAASPTADEADSTADKSSNSVLSPFAAVPPTGDLISDIAPSADDPTNDNSDAAPVGGPNADYPPSKGDHYKDDIGSGSSVINKVATVTVSSISFLAAGYLFF